MVILSASALYAKQAADSETGVAPPVRHRFIRCHLERAGVGLKFGHSAAAKPKCLCAASHAASSTSSTKTTGILVRAQFFYLPILALQGVIQVPLRECWHLFPTAKRLAATQDWQLGARFCRLR